MSELKFELMKAVDEDGWSEWIHPLEGYLMKCCGCGCVHEMDARPATIVERNSDGTFSWDDVQADDLVVMFRMKRRDEFSSIANIGADTPKPPNE